MVVPAAAFDDEVLISDARLTPVMRLAVKAGPRQQVRQRFMYRAGSTVATAGGLDSTPGLVSARSEVAA
jgi:hypothetical protein